MLGDFLNVATAYSLFAPHELMPLDFYLNL